MDHKTIRLGTLNLFLVPVCLLAAATSSIALVFIQYIAPERMVFKYESAYLLMLFGVVLMTVLFFLLLRAKVFLPLMSLCGQLNQITAERAWGRRVDSHCDVQEINDIANDVNQLLESAEKDFVSILEVAVKDPLTSLLNRRGVIVAIDDEVERSARAGAQFSIMMLDLDNFKQINDTYGHHAGDQALHQVSSRLKKVLRKIDVVARIGGDEFMILLPMTSKNQAMLVANKIHTALNKYKVDVGDAVLTATASIGVATYPEDGMNRTTLQNAVDVVMYQAKQRGKNSVSACETVAQSTAVVTPMRGKQNDGAAGAGDVKLALRPIASAKTRNVVAYEACAWIKTGKDYIAAAEMLQYAATKNCLDDIDDVTLARGLAKLADMKLGTKMFFTFSVGSLADQNWRKKLLLLAKQEGVPCSQIVIQLDANDTKNSADSLRANIKELHDSGIQFSLTGFGGVASALQQIRELNADYIEFDRVLTGNINAANLSAIESLQMVANVFGIETIATRIGSKEAVDKLSAVGVAYAQGEHIGKTYVVEEESRPAEKRAPYMGMHLAAAGAID